MEGEQTQFNYGDGSGFINVYLPRVDGTLADMRNVTPPSPVFTLENIYKFSDQVLNDRQLFLNRRAYFHRYPKRREKREVETPPKTSRSIGFEREREDNPGINVVKLSLDASGKPVPSSPRDRRFNERLSAYVTRKKKVQNSDEEKIEDTKESGAHDVSSPNTKKMTERASKLLHSSPGGQNVSLRRPKMRRGLTFFNRSTTDLHKMGLPLVETPRIHDKQKPTFTLNTERTMWFPDNVISGAHLKFGYGRLPTRPSSKPNKIWRQSSDMMSTQYVPSERDVLSVLSAPLPRTNRHSRILRQKTFV